MGRDGHVYLDSEMTVAGVESSADRTACERNFYPSPTSVYAMSNFSGKGPLGPYPFLPSHSPKATRSSFVLQPWKVAGTTGNYIPCFHMAERLPCFFLYYPTGDNRSINMRFTVSLWIAGSCMEQSGPYHFCKVFSSTGSAHKNILLNLEVITWPFSGFFNCTKWRQFSLGH